MAVAEKASTVCLVFVDSRNIADGLRWVEATPRLCRDVGTQRSEVPERSGAGTRRTAAATCTIADSPNIKNVMLSFDN